MKYYCLKVNSHKKIPHCIPSGHSAMTHPYGSIIQAWPYEDLLGLWTPVWAAAIT